MFYGNFQRNLSVGSSPPFPWTLESCIWLIALEIFDHRRSKNHRAPWPWVNNALFKRKQPKILSTTQVQSVDTFKCEYIMTCFVWFSYFCFVKFFLPLIRRLLHDFVLKSTLEEHQSNADMMPLRQHWDCVWRCGVINFLQRKHKRVGWSWRNWDHGAQNDDDTHSCDWAGCVCVRARARVCAST